MRPENCGTGGPEGACCLPKGHVGPHTRPAIRWVEWGTLAEARWYAEANARMLVEQAPGFVPFFPWTHSGRPTT